MKDRIEDSIEQKFITVADNQSTALVVNPRDLKFEVYLYSSKCLWVH